MAGLQTTRADNFAKKITKKQPEDPRSTEDKLADIARDYDPVRMMKKARARMHKKV